jgi:hypothetical protein
MKVSIQWLLSFAVWVSVVSQVVAQHSAGGRDRWPNPVDVATPQAVKGAFWGIAPVLQDLLREEDPAFLTVVAVVYWDDPHFPDQRRQALREQMAAAGVGPDSLDAERARAAIRDWLSKRLEALEPNARQEALLAAEEFFAVSLRDKYPNLRRARSFEDRLAAQQEAIWTLSERYNGPGANPLEHGGTRFLAERYLAAGLSREDLYPKRMRESVLRWKARQHASLDDPLKKAAIISEMKRLGATNAEIDGLLAGRDKAVGQLLSEWKTNRSTEARQAIVRELSSRPLAQGDVEHLIGEFRMSAPQTHPSGGSTDTSETNALVLRLLSRDVSRRGKEFLVDIVSAADSPGDVRRAAIESLATRADLEPQEAFHLVASASAPDRMMSRAFAAHPQWTRRQDLFGGAVALLRSERPLDRIAAARVLGGMDSAFSPWLVLLEQLNRDGDARVRIEVASALAGRFALTAGVAPDLMKTVRDRTLPLRERVAVVQAIPMAMVLTSEEDITRLQELISALDALAKETGGQDQALADVATARAGHLKGMLERRLARPGWRPQGPEVSRSERNRAVLSQRIAILRERLRQEQAKERNAWVYMPQMQEGLDDLKRTVQAWEKRGDLSAPDAQSVMQEAQQFLGILAATTQPGG